MQLGLIDDIVIFIVLFLVVSLRNTDGTDIQWAYSARTHELQTNRTTYDTVFTSDAVQIIKFEPRM